jgi:outer membrane protein TolC
LLLIGLAGCSRGYYRKSADRETYPIIAERVVSPAYAVGKITVEAAPQSRIADPTSQDRPAKPPDDVAAAGFMAHPGKFRGARGWDEDGVIDRIEPDGWEAGLGLEPDGTLKLNRDKATEIALDNSREYQTQRENVYLNALGLTLNRFEFDARYFGRNSTGLARVGASALPTESNTLTTASDVGLTRNFAAGGQLLTDFANSFVWEFTGQSHAVAGVFSASLIQPLLRGFGRKIRLESLTQAERDVLYAVRGYARYRKLFWAGVNVDPGGYLQLLRAVQAVRNAKANLKSQEENYALYLKLFAGGRINVANVDQVYQGLLGARLDIISSELQLQNDLDAFKLRLGLPPRLPVELDDSPLKPFVLTDPGVEKLREELDAFERQRKSELDAPPSLDVLRTSLAALNGFAERALLAIDEMEADMTRWKADLDAADGPAAEQEQRTRARQAYAQQAKRPAELRAALAKLRAELARLPAQLSEANRRDSWRGVIAGSRDIAAILDVVISVEAQARIYVIKLPEIGWTEADATAFAKANRLDLQNVQSQVTDAWRQVTVTANALQSDLTIRADGALVADPTSRNPFNFANDYSRLSLGVAFDGPLNRQAERNAYRRSQINYQRSRRAFMELSDGVELDVRGGLRALTLQRFSFEIARQQLLVAVRQLTIERRNLTAPVQQGQRGFDDAATLRILTAQRQLLDARNQLANNFFGYEQQRIRFLINLEALTMDERGLPTNATPATAPARLAGPGDAARAGTAPVDLNPVAEPPPP